MALRIVTDSACGLDRDERDCLSILTVPLHVVADGKDVPETELQQPAFYDRLADMATLPSTSQPSPEEFASVFRQVLDDGDEVLAVLISAGMSGTVQSAELAATTVKAERPGAVIEILDSRSNSLEEGFVVRAAAEAAAAGTSIGECRRAGEETTRRTRFLFAPHTLEYLRRGGRISGAAGLLGMTLRIAPILTASHGSTGVAGAARSGRSAHRRIRSLFARDVDRCGLKQVAVQYVADREEAMRFATEMIEPIAGLQVPVVPIHPVVGLHVGPAVGVVYETVRPLR